MTVARSNASRTTWIVGRLSAARFNGSQSLRMNAFLQPASQFSKVHRTLPQLDCNRRALVNTSPFFEHLFLRSLPLPFLSCELFLPLFNVSKCASEASALPYTQSSCYKTKWFQSQGSKSKLSSRGSATLPCYLKQNLEYASYAVWMLLSLPQGIWPDGSVH